MSVVEVEQLKRLTTVALFSDDQLLNRLVLKGANALSLAYGITARASFDLDFSMEGDFDPAELADIIRRVEFRLQQAFTPVGYEAFDVQLDPKPKHITDDLKDYWGGYSLEFKVISAARYRALDGDLRAIRREAIPPRPGGRARFEIDISRHEFCTGKTAFEIDQFTVFVYTPAMILCEKIRAICQQRPSYTRLVKSHQAPRARDFFDINQIIHRFGIDVATDENLELFKNMFKAKRVPLELLDEIEADRDLHLQEWDAVRDTVAPAVDLREFGFYFEFVVTLCRKVANLLAP